MTWTSAGWASGTSGHCVVRITEKTGEDTVAMTFCNSGQGLGAHPGVSVLNSPGPIDNYPRGKAICAMRIDHLSLSSKSMMDLGNWHWLFRCAEFGDRLHPTMNYHYGVPQFAGRTLREAARDSSDLQGWPSTGQRGPTCWYNGPAKAFQYLLRRFGFSKSDIKEVTHSARLFWCVKISEQLAAIRCDAGQADAPLAAAAVPNGGYGSSLWTGKWGFFYFWDSFDLFSCFELTHTPSSLYSSRLALLPASSRRRHGKAATGDAQSRQQDRLGDGRHLLSQSKRQRNQAPRPRTPDGRRPPPVSCGLPPLAAAASLPVDVLAPFAACPSAVSRAQHLGRQWKPAASVSAGISTARHQPAARASSRLAADQPRRKSRAVGRDRVSAQARRFFGGRQPGQRQDAPGSAAGPTRSRDDLPRHSRPLREPRRSRWIQAPRPRTFALMLCRQSRRPVPFAR